MLAGKRVRIVSTRTFKHLQGCMGVVDAFGLKSEDNGYFSGGIDIEQGQGYMFLTAVKVTEEPTIEDNIIIGEN
jgi:hypothetical protein